eukprot:5914321-Pleurochrysis_carterae.AAC.2
MQGRRRLPSACAVHREVKCPAPCRRGAHRAASPGQLRLIRHRTPHSESARIPSPDAGLFEIWSPSVCHQHG